MIQWLQTKYNPPKGNQMKLIYFLIILWSLSPFISAMDYTPPKEVPAYLREIVDSVIHEDEKAQVDLRQHKRHSREHTVIEINASVTDADGKETKLEWKKDGTLSKSTDSDEKKTTTTYSKRFVIVTNSVTAACLTVIGAGVTLAIKYGECKK